MRILRGLTKPSSRAATTAAAIVTVLSLMPAVSSAAVRGTSTHGQAASVALSPHIPNSGYFNLDNVRANNPQRCLGIDSQGWAGLWTCTTNADQIWHWLPVGDGHGGLELANNTTQNGTPMCLSVPGANTSEGIRINVYPCGGYPDQFWQPTATPTGQGDYLVNDHSNLVLAVANNGSTANGTPIIQWTGCNCSDQFWWASLI